VRTTNHLTYELCSPILKKTLSNNGHTWETVHSHRMHEVHVCSAAAKFTHLLAVQFWRHNDFGGRSVIRIVVASEPRTSTLTSEVTSIAIPISAISVATAAPERHCLLSWRSTSWIPPLQIRSGASGEFGALEYMRGLLVQRRKRKAGEERNQVRHCTAYTHFCAIARVVA